MVIFDDEAAVLAADLDGVFEGRRREILEESVADFGPAFRICRRGRGHHQGHQGQARRERHDWMVEISWESDWEEIEGVFL